MKQSAVLKNVSLASGRFEKERLYWEEKLAGEINRSAFPYDYGKAGARGSTGIELSTVTKSFEGELFERLKKLSNGVDYTLHMILVAVTAVLIQKYGYEDRDDIILGAPIYKQDTGKDTEFINTVLALRARLQKEMTFKELLMQIRQTMLEADENKNYPIELLVEHLQLTMTERYFPLFDTAVLLENIHEPGYLRAVPVNMIFKFRRRQEMVELELEYNSGIFDPRAVERLAGHFTRLLQHLIFNVDIQIDTVEIAGEEEIKTLMEEFSGTGRVEMSSGGINQMTDVLQAFGTQVQAHPEQPATAGLSCKTENHRGKTFTSLTYGELDEAARRLAQRLETVGVGPDSVVALMMERNVEAVVGIMGILKAGGAYMPIDPDYPSERISFMLENSSAAALVTVETLWNKRETEPVKAAENTEIILMDGIPGIMEDAPLMPPDEPVQNRYKNLSNHLCYVIYTSGSTGRPKGVMVEHRNVLNLVEGLRQRIYRQYDGPQRVAQVAPFIFDASVQQIFGTLLQGHTLVVVPEETRVDGRGLIDFYRRHQIDISDGTPAHLQLMAEGTERRPVDMGVKHFIIGGEALERKTMEAFYGVINGVGPIVTNVYGPTECCVDSTYYDITRDILATLKHGIIPIGRPLPHQEIYILDRQGRLQPAGVPGELCIAGGNVGRGYLGNRELTTERFIQRPTPLKHGESSPTIDEGCPTDDDFLYKTGDLARWLPDGNIQFLGRMDNQVKIRGFRIELEELESLLTGHDGVQDAAVVAKQREGADEEDGMDVFLCAYVVPANDAEDKSHPDKPTRTQLREYLAKMLPDYMIPPVYVFLDKLPLTPAGKINRRALPQPDLRQLEEEYTAPRNTIEKTLAEIWGETLKRDSQSIGIDTGFFNIGGHSLKATVMISEIHKRLKVKVPLSEVFKTPTIRGLARYIGTAEESSYTTIPRAPEQEDYPLSFAQRRLWVLCQFEEDSAAYNIPAATAFKGELNLEAFREAGQALADRHESLRTVFILKNAEPRQKILTDLQFQLEVHDLEDRNSGDNAEKTLQQARDIYLDFANGVFDLEKGPLYKIGIIKMAADRYLLMFNIHHIITDGWSTGILINDFITCYNGYVNGRDHRQPPPELRYRDYTLWHNDRSDGGYFDTSGKYWLKKFGDKPNGIELPVDHPRSAIQTFNGGRVTFTVDRLRTEELYRLAGSRDATLFMVLLALLDILLNRLTGQEDIIVGSPIAGRRSPELHSLVGFLVNTLVFRINVDNNLTLSQLLQKVKEEALESYEYQDYPFDLLVERLALERDLSRSPLFNVMLAHNNAETEDDQLGLEGVGFDEFPYSGDFNMSKFDLTFFMDEMGDRIFVQIEYNSDLFENSTIRRLADNFMALVDDVIQKGPEHRVRDLNAIAPEQYETVVREFNRNKEEYPPFTVQQLFEAQVEKIPEATALVTPEQETVTYAQLNRRANRIAHYLREEYNVCPGDVVGICCQRSILMIQLIMGIVKSGAAYLSIDPNYPEERIRHMLQNSRTRLVVVDEPRPQLFQRYREENRGTVIDIGQQQQHIDNRSPENPHLLNRPEDPLYVIYTSGSTGIPNGALLSQGILSNLVRWQHNKTSIQPDLRTLQFTSINFCVSFQEIFVTLAGGGEVHLIGDIQRQDIDYLLEYLDTHRIELLYLPFSYLNFLFNESNRWDINRKTYLKHIVTAGEQLKITAGLKRFLEQNPSVRLHNHYGSSEMHVVTSYTLETADIERTPVPPAGKPVDNTSIYILDDHGRPVPVGVWGELCIAGSSEVLGYIHNPELTRKKIAHHPELPEPEPEPGVPAESRKRLYRSGDIGRWLEDGNIQLKGRKDTQVKIRGFRVELAEIESRILAQPGVTDCVTVVKEEDSPQGVKTTVQQYLAAYVVTSDPNLDAADIKRKMAGQLPQYMIPKIVIMERLPLMPNGKVDREKLPDISIDARQGTVVPPETPEQRILASIWSRLLDLPEPEIGIEDNFFERGGHSLKATTMMTEIHKQLNVRIELLEIFKTPTIRELAQHIEGLKRDVHQSVQAVEEKEYYPLSSGQKRMFILQQLDPQSTAYNMPALLQLEGELEEERFLQAFQQLIRRHESLRTSFEQIHKQPVQRIHDEVDFKIEKTDSMNNNSSGCNDAINRVHQKNDGTSDFVQPFDLSRAPLLRVRLIKVEERKHILAVDMHHIISDGTSLGVLVREFMEYYDHREPEPLQLRYRDYTLWQQNMVRDGSLEKQEKFWQEQFKEEMPVLELPIDKTRPKVMTYEGETVGVGVGEEETRAMRELAKTHGATLFMVLAAQLNVLLAEMSGQEDIVIGTPVGGRNHADLQPIIGMFVNTLALRNNPAPHKTFTEFLEEVKRKTLEAFSNQDIPFEELVERLDIPRHTGRSPMFDVMLSLQNTEIPRLEIPGLELKPYPGDRRTTKYDLTFAVTETENDIYIQASYRTALFQQETVQRILDYYKTVIEAVRQNPYREIADIPLITDAEAAQMIERFNDVERPYPGDKTIIELFRRQVQTAPENTALVAAINGKELETASLTYRRLNEESDRLAGRLQDKGIGKGDIVAISVPPSLEMVTGMLGILKTGAAFLPIDPNIPEMRINYILADSNAAALIRKPESRNSNNETKNGECIVLDFDLSNLENESDFKYQAPDITPSDLAYVIYTSGSTGRPKGVMIRHQSLVNLCTWHNRQYEVTPADRAAKYAALGFDVTIWEIFPYLQMGAAIYMVDDDLKLDPRALNRYYARHEITITFLPPQIYTRYAEQEEPPPSLRLMVVGGDKLKRYVPRPFRVFNNYGPTENTVVSTSCEVTEDSDNIPIGIPVDNTRAYILDRSGHLQPQGIPGELVLGGDSIAIGYLNNPELTAEKFIEPQGILRGDSQEKTSVPSGTKLYKTGDLVRWLPDGNIQFLGRIDQQVKIRGNRIELGEIESVLAKHPALNSAVVVDRENKTGEKFLCGYVVPIPEGPLKGMTESNLAKELKNHLAPLLPDYMIPAHFMAIEKIPLTGNGKIDKRVLPEVIIRSGAEYIAPKNHPEMIAADIWKEILGVDDIGIDDNFFDLGGNSLDIIQLAEGLKKAFKVEIPTVTMFQYPTIRTFLEYINGLQGESHRQKLQKQEGAAGTSDETRDKPQFQTIDKGREMMKRRLNNRQRRK
jgi:amino acid adenylation domain-containing protein